MPSRRARQSNMKNEVNVKCEPVDIQDVASPKSQYQFMFEQMDTSNEDKLKVDFA